MLKLGIIVEKSSSYNHQSVGCIERIFQTVKQIMVRNTDNTWLAMLIFKATDIPAIDKSPSELLNTRKFRTNLPSIDINQKSNETKIKKLADRWLSTPKSWKELPKIPVGMPILYEIIPIQARLNIPIGAKAQ